MNKMRRPFFIGALAIGVFAGIGYYFYIPSKSAITIREFDYQQDYQFVKDVYEKNKYWLFEGDDDEGYINHLLNEHRSLFEVSPYEHETIKIMLAENHPVGFVTYSKTKFYQGKVRLLGVSENYRGKGYGYLLLKHAMDDLIAHGATNIYLITRTTNYPAHKIYKKAGFKQTEVHNGIVRFDYYV